MGREAKPILQRFAVLDGIRGLAALFVLTRHTPGFWGFSLFRSYIAVDLFFILSGFVIAHAYEKKLERGTLSAGDFCLTRLIRLYPMYFMSFLACLVMAAARLHWRSKGYESVDGIAVVALFTLFMLPSVLGSSASLFPMNGPYWSLFFELVVNFAYAAFRPLLTNQRLTAIVPVLAAGVALASFANGNLDVGFEWGGKSIAAGLLRAAFGISFGLLIFRRIDWVAKKFRIPANPWPAILFILVALGSPSLGRLDWLVDVVVVLLAFPLCVAVCSQAGPSQFDRAFLLLGAASYPVYVLHQPMGQIIAALSTGLESHAAPLSGLVFVAGLLALSLALEKYLDIPIRRRLTAILIAK